jgi:mRNA-degrading endonuclease RelE of RelBE toxin-antitoxin system
MNIRLTTRARRDFSELPPNLKTQVRKQFALLQDNLRHPSLQAKKYDDRNDIWQGRVNRSYRFYFQIVEDDYIVVRIIPHPK